MVPEVPLSSGLWLYHRGWQGIPDPAVKPRGLAPTYSHGGCMRKTAVKSYQAWQRTTRRREPVVGKLVGAIGVVVP